MKLIKRNKLGEIISSIEGHLWDATLWSYMLENDDYELEVIQ